MSKEDDALEVKRIAEREIEELDNELLGDQLTGAQRATVQAKLGQLTLVVGRLEALLLSGNPAALKEPTAQDRQRIRAAAEALDEVIARQKQASAIISSVQAALDVFVI